MNTKGKLKSASLEITIHRHETGKTEDLGYVIYYHSNPFIHYPVNLMIWIRGKIRLWQLFLQTKVKK